MQLLQGAEINGEVGGIYISKIQPNVQLVAVLNVYMAEFVTWIRAKLVAEFSERTYSHLVKSILNLKQKIGLQFLDILCVSDRQKCRQLKNQSGLVSFFANPD